MPDFSKYAKSYDKHLEASLSRHGEDLGFFAQYKVELAARRLANARVQAVLDFGCGPGRGLPFIAHQFPQAELWAYDPSEACAGEASLQVPGARVVSRSEDLPVGHFDCVFLCNVLHHIPESGRVAELRRCRDALNAIGSLFVFEHNPFNPLTRLVFERCPFDQDAEMLRLSAMRSAGAEAGLRVIGAGYCLFVPSAFGGIYRLEDFLGWLPLGAQYYVRFQR